MPIFWRVQESSSPNLSSWTFFLKEYIPTKYTLVSTPLKGTFKVVRGKLIRIPNAS